MCISVLNSFNKEISYSNNNENSCRTIYPRKMVFFRYTIVNILNTGEKYNNNNNNYRKQPYWALHTYFGKY